jgi:hypothetical protein
VHWRRADVHERGIPLVPARFSGSENRPRAVSEPIFGSEDRYCLKPQRFSVSADGIGLSPERYFASKNRIGFSWERFSEAEEGFEVIRLRYFVPNVGTGLPHE